MFINKIEIEQNAAPDTFIAPVSIDNPPEITSYQFINFDIPVFDIAAIMGGYYNE
jgi:hypothetical protein